MMSAIRVFLRRPDRTGTMASQVRVSLASSENSVWVSAAMGRGSQPPVMPTPGDLTSSGY